MWERLERRAIRRRRIVRPDTGGRPRPDLPEGSDLLPQIRHIVVLMMENHSYDNYLGMLAGRGEGLPLGPGGAPDAVNYTPDGKAFRAHHLPATSQAKNNPSQNWRASHIQYADGRNDGVAAAVAEALPGADPAVPMGYWTEDDLPFYYGLARTFPLADRWFSSCLGPTFPNRRFLISGTGAWPTCWTTAPGPERSPGPGCTPRATASTGPPRRTTSSATCPPGAGP